jgi:hypothetical protein
VFVCSNFFQATEVRSHLPRAKYEQCSMAKLLFFAIISLPSASSGIRTLDLSYKRRGLNHCATGSQHWQAACLVEEIIKRSSLFPHRILDKEGQGCNVDNRLKTRCFVKFAVTSWRGAPTRTTTTWCQCYKTFYGRKFRIVTIS